MEYQKMMRTTMKKVPLVILWLILGLGSTHGKTIHLLHPRRASGGSVYGLSCVSWRFGVETNSIVGWKAIPGQCESYVGHYMLGKQYRDDSAAVNDAALAYVNTLNLPAHAHANNLLWVFDIDETTLSNLPYYAHHGFGAELFNATAFNLWANKGKAPAMPESRKLYKKLIWLGIKVVFLTGRAESQREATEANLKKQGYTTFHKLILKNGSYPNTIAYKSGERAKLERAGFRIIGNMGDQWSDLLGAPTGNRTFKLPDPMYYIA